MQVHVHSSYRTIGRDISQQFENLTDRLTVHAE